jgi:hypothetical protein
LHTFFGCGITKAKDRPKRVVASRKAGYAKAEGTIKMEASELKSAISELSARIAKIRDWL